MEATVVHADAREDLLASASSKQQNSLSHFDCFLQDHCVQIGVPVVKAEAIPYHSLPLNESPRDVNEFWDKLFGAFTTCLCGAKHRCDPNRETVMFSTADGHLSSAKKHFATKFRHEPPISVFETKQGSDLQDRLKARFRDSSRVSGKPMAKPKHSSTREDREALSKGCIWLGTAEAAEFWHLLNGTFHCSGRGSEVALLTASGTSSAEINESVHRHNVLQTEIQRQKGNPLQTVLICPDRDGVLEDFYFSLIHLLVMVGCDNEHVFPTCSLEALKTKNSKSVSNVSTLWKARFGELVEELEGMNVSANPALRSHSNRRGSNQVMAESHSASGLPQHFRTGWQGAANTNFECIIGSLVLSQKARNALANWTAKIGDVIVGGQPVTLEDIVVSPTPPSFSPLRVALSPVSDSDDLDEDLPLSGTREMLQCFTNASFEDDVIERWNPEVRELLVASLLSWHEQFCDVLRSYPFASVPGLTFKTCHPSVFKLEKSHDFDTIRNHLFICRVEAALEKASASKEIFKCWCKRARSAFLSRNAPGTVDFSLCGGDQGAVLMDPRCFVDNMNAVAHLSQSTCVVVQELRHWLNDLTEIVTQHLAQRHCEGVNWLSMAHSIARLEEHFIPPPEPVTSPAPKGVIKFSISGKALNTKHESVSDVTAKFFVDNHIAGFVFDKESESWKDLGKDQRRKLSNQFAATKCAVRMVLMHADSFPTSLDKKSNERMAKRQRNASEMTLNLTRTRPSPFARCKSTKRPGNFRLSWSFQQMLQKMFEGSSKVESNSQFGHQSFPTCCVVALKQSVDSVCPRSDRSLSLALEFPFRFPRTPIRRAGGKHLLITHQTL